MDEGSLSSKFIASEFTSVHGFVGYSLTSLVMVVTQWFQTPELPLEQSKVDSGRQDHVLVPWSLAVISLVGPSSPVISFRIQQFSILTAFTLSTLSILLSYP